MLRKLLLAILALGALSPAWAAITVVQANGAVSPGTPQNITGVTAGNTLVICGTYHNYGGGMTLPTVTDTNGTWLNAEVPAYTTAYGSQPVGVVSYYLPNAAAGTHALTWHADSGGGGVYVDGWAEISGLTTSVLFDKSATNSNTTNGVTSGNPGTTPATTVANEIVLACMSIYSNAGASSAGLTDPPTGFTSIFANQNTTANPGFEMAYKVISATGTQTTAWTWTDATEETYQASIETFGANTVIFHGQGGFALSPSN